MALAVLTGLPLPLLPLQILFLNLVTDVFPAFALATGEGEEDVLLKPPRDPAEPLLGRPQWAFIAAYGALITGATLASLLIGRYLLLLEGEALVSVSFLTLAFAQLWHVFAMRGAGSRLLRNAVTRNLYVWLAVGFCAGLLLLATYVPPLARVLHIAAPDRSGWMLILSTSIAPLILGQGIMALARLVRPPAKALPRKREREPVMGKPRLHPMRLAKNAHPLRDRTGIAAHDLAAAMGEDRPPHFFLRAPEELGHNRRMPDQRIIPVAHHGAFDRGAVPHIEVDAT